MVFLGWGYFAKIQTPKKKPKRFAFKLGQNQEIFVWGQGPSTKIPKSNYWVASLYRSWKFDFGQKIMGQMCGAIPPHLLEHIGNMGNMSGCTLRTIDNLWEHARNTKFPKFKPHTHSPTPLNPSRKKEGPSWERIDPSNWLNENIKNIKINK